jgi:hypothetical protein
MLFICSYYAFFLFILCSLFVHTMHLFVHTMHLFVHTMHFSLPLLLVLVVLVAVEVLPAVLTCTPGLGCYVQEPQTSAAPRTIHLEAHLRWSPWNNGACKVRRMTCALTLSGMHDRCKRNERRTSPCHVNTRTVPYNTPFTRKQSCPGTLVITERHLPLMTFA